MNMLIHLYVYLYTLIIIPNIPSADIIIPKILLSIFIATLGEGGLHTLGYFTSLHLRKTYSSPPS